MSPHESGEQHAGRTSRRGFLRKTGRAFYAVPLVVTYRITEVYDEESGYARAQTLTPPNMPHPGK